jgi:hypothetical protein
VRKAYDPVLEELIEADEKRSRLYSLGKTVHSSPPAPSHRPSPKLDLSLVRYETSLDHGNWAIPNGMISLLDHELEALGDHDTVHTNVKLALECLTNFQRRVEVARWAFRHPVCRANHSLLVMAGYEHAHALSLCGAGGRPCSRRRFCPSCSYRDAEKRMGRFISSFDADLTIGFTLSWKFPDRAVPGIPFTDHDHYGMAETMLDQGENAMRAMSRSGLVAGVLGMEQLAVLSLAPLRVLPHLHGLLMRLRRRQGLRKLKTALEAAILSALPGLSSLGIVPDIRFEKLATDTDCARWLNYSFTCFGLGKNGTTLPDTYNRAWRGCASVEQREALNAEVADLVDGAVAVLSDGVNVDRHAGRHRCIAVGCYAPRAKAYVGIKRIAKELKAYLKDLRERVRAEDMGSEEAGPYDDEARYLKATDGIHDDDDVYKGDGNMSRT